MEEQLEPELGDLVLDDEEQLVVLLRLAAGVLRRQERVEVEVGAVGHRPAEVGRDALLEGTLGSVDGVIAHAGIMPGRATARTCARSRPRDGIRRVGREGSAERAVPVGAHDPEGQRGVTPMRAAWPAPSTLTVATAVPSRHGLLERKRLVLREEQALDAALEPPARVVTGQVEPVGRRGALHGAADPDLTLPRQRDVCRAAARVQRLELGLGQLDLSGVGGRQVGVGQVDVGAPEGVHGVDGRDAQRDLLPGEPGGQRRPDRDDDQGQARDDHRGDAGRAGGQEPGVGAPGSGWTGAGSTTVVMTRPPSPRGRAVVGRGRRARRSAAGRLPWRGRARHRRAPARTRRTPGRW